MNRKIKSTLFAATAAAIAFSSCSQDETVDALVQNSDRQEIEFHLDMMSRAADKTIANLDTIWVYADDGSETVFEATPFIKDKYGNFKSAEKIYWPDGKDVINFTAFWPSPEKLDITAQPGQVTVDHTTSNLTDKHYDLITASTKVSKQNYINGIPLSFTHAFAQVEFRAKIGNEATHRFEIYGMSIAKVQNKGVYDLKTNEWTNATSTFSCYAAPEEIITVGEEPASMTDKTGSLYIIPQLLNIQYIIPKILLVEFS